MLIVHYSQNEKVTNLICFPINMKLLTMLELTNLLSCINKINSLYVNISKKSYGVVYVIIKIILMLVITLITALHKTK